MKKGMQLESYKRKLGGEEGDWAAEEGDRQSVGKKAEWWVTVKTQTFVLKNSGAEFCQNLSTPRAPWPGLFPDWLGSLGILPLPPAPVIPVAFHNLLISAWFSEEGGVPG
jgi:hypothetical protein